MMRTKLFSAMVLLLASLPALSDAPAAAKLPPDQVVQQTARDMLDAVAAKRAELQKNPQQLYDLVGKILLPNFDFDLASRLVLGRYWTSATPDQRKSFEDAFYKYLVHSYADALLKGNYSDRNLQVEPWHGAAGDTRATVKTKVTRDNAPPVEVDYVLNNGTGGWKAFDVTIEGISYVLNYRNQFGPEIQQNGIDELIKRLNTEAEKGPATAPAASG